MDVTPDTLARAFAGQGSVLVGIVARIDDLSVPTRLGGWTARVLVGHVSATIEVLWRWQGQAPPDSPELDAVSWWTPTAASADVIDQFAVAYAAKRTDDDLRAGLEAALERGRVVVADTEPSATVLLPATVVSARFDQFVMTRLVEMVVHGLDLAAAGGLDATADPDALGIVAAILDERLDGPRPADLTDDLAWVEAATGRTDHADERLPILV